MRTASRRARESHPTIEALQSWIEHGGATAATCLASSEGASANSLFRNGVHVPVELLRSAALPGGIGVNPNVLGQFLFCERSKSGRLFCRPPGPREHRP